MIWDIFIIVKGINLLTVTERKLGKINSRMIWDIIIVVEGINLPAIIGRTRPYTRLSQSRAGGQGQ